MTEIATGKQPASTGIVPLRLPQIVAVDERAGFDPARLQLRRDGTALPTQARPLRYHSDGVSPSIFELTALTDGAIAAEGDVTVELLDTPASSTPQALSADMQALLATGLHLELDGQDGPAKVRLTERGMGDVAASVDPRAGEVFWTSEVDSLIPRHGSVYSFARAWTVMDLLELDLLCSNYDIANPCPDLRLTSIQIELPAGWEWRAVLDYRQGAASSATVFDPCADGTNTLLQGQTISWRLLIYRTADADAARAATWMREGKHLSVPHDGTWTFFTVPGLASTLSTPMPRLIREGGEAAMRTRSSGLWAGMAAAYGVAGQLVPGPLTSQPDQTPWGMWHADSGYQGGQTGGSGLGVAPNPDLVVAGDADAYRYSLAIHTTDQARFSGNPVVQARPYMPELFRNAAGSDITNLEFFMAPSVDPKPLGKGFGSGSQTQYGFNQVPSRDDTDPEAASYESDMRRMGSIDGAHMQRWLTRRQLMAFCWCDPIAQREILCRAPWFYVERWYGAATNMTNGQKRQLGVLVDQVAASPNQGVRSGRQETLVLHMCAEACATAGPEFAYVRKPLLEWMGTMLTLLRDARMSNGLWQRKDIGKDRELVSPSGASGNDLRSFSRTRPLNYSLMFWSAFLQVWDEALTRFPALADFTAELVPGLEFQQPHWSIPQAQYAKGNAYLHAIDNGPGTAYYETPADVPMDDLANDSGWETSPINTGAWADATLDDFYVSGGVAAALTRAEAVNDTDSMSRLAVVLQRNAETSGSFANYIAGMSPDDWGISAGLIAWEEQHADPDAKLAEYAAL